MASDDIEVEIKIPLEKAEFLNVKEKVSRLAEFVKNAHHVDEYYTPTHRDFLGPEYPFEWLRIRKSGNKTVLNYKHFFPENTEVTTHCKEFETAVDNVDLLEKIMSALDFKKLVVVEKDREVYLYDEKFEIALDFVNELGYFIEIEATRDLGGVEETKKKVIEFAEKLGIDTSKMNKRGYPILLMKKRGLTP